ARAAAGALGRADQRALSRRARAERVRHVGAVPARGGDRRAGEHAAALSAPEPRRPGSRGRGAGRRAVRRRGRLMARLVLLLRGINVGKHKRIGMADLRAMLSERGYEDVKTHLQSGNVVLSSRKAPATVGRDVEQGIRELSGHEVDVVVRTADQLAETVAAD